MVKEVTSLDQFHEVINSGNPVVIDFWATWVGPCRFISPVFEQMAAATPSVEFYKVDVDEVPGVSEAAGIRAMPAFIAYLNGKEVEQLVDANPVVSSLLTKAMAYEF